MYLCPKSEGESEGKSEGKRGYPHVPSALCTSAFHAYWVSGVRVIPQQEVGN